MNTQHPVVQKPVVDAITFVLPWGVDCDKDEYLPSLVPILRRLDFAIENGMCERVFRPGARYRQSFKIHFGTRHHAFVQVGAVRPDNQKGGIRIDVNPARFEDGDVQHLHAVMKRIVGRQYTNLLLSPLLNRIDFAVDVLHVDLDRMLVDYSHAQHLTMFCKRLTRRGRIEGFNFGSVTSDYINAVYDKRIERVHAAALNLIKNGKGKGNDELRDNAIKRLEETRNAPAGMRVEIRGKKMRGLELRHLDGLPNRFASFRFTDLSQGGTQLSEFDKETFRAFCEQRGVKAALALFKGTPQASKVRKYWQSRQATWWQPESLWADACAALRDTGLFPDAAFEKPEVSDLADSIKEMRRDRQRWSTSGKRATSAD